MQIMTWLRRWLSGSRDTFVAAVAPDIPFVAIADVHGCSDKLQSLLVEIAELDVSAHLVLVGDYIDRGDDSANVLRAVIALDAGEHVTCLMGNHEAMLLAFLDDPIKAGPIWLANGGLQTLWSFGLCEVSEHASDDILEDTAQHLREAMGLEMIEWIEARPTLWQSGNVAVVHAGADPAVSMSEQDEKHLMWGHRDFHRSTRKDGVWVVHGHTIVDEPRVKDGRISIDTGAYATGALTAARVSKGSVIFISTH